MRPSIARGAAVILVCLHVAAKAAAQGDTSRAELAVLEAGRQVVRNTAVAGSAWPRVTIHQFIATSPAEAAATFADYARHSTYLPGIKRSAISHRVSVAVAEVDYVLEVPVFPDESYTVRDSISSDSSGSYRVDWRMVRARSTKAIVGSALFRPHRNSRSGIDGTLLTYDNLVIPGQALAGPLKGRALKQVRETVVALVGAIERARRADPELVAAQARALRDALAAGNPRAPDAPPPFTARTFSAPRAADRAATHAPEDRSPRSSSPQRAWR